MKKILSLLTISSFFSMVTLNTVSCTKTSSETKLTSFKNNTFALGDSLSDGGALSSVADGLFNDPWVQNQDLKTVLPSMINVFGSGLIPSSIASNIPKGFDIQQLTEALQDKGINKIQIEGDENYMQNSYKNGDQTYKGLSFSNSDTAASLLIKHYDDQMTPAWDSNIEKIKLTGNNGEHNLFNSLNGNNYAVGGATSHEVSTKESSSGYFQDSILYQVKTLIEQHKDLSNSLVSLGIGGNDLLFQNYSNADSNGDLDPNIIKYLVGSMSKEQNLPKDMSEDNGNNAKNTLNEINDITKNNNILSSIGQLYQALTLLKNAGVKHLILMNAPDISKTPMMIQKSDENSLKEIKNATNLYNNFLEAIFNKISNNNSDWKIFSLYNELNNAINLTTKKSPKNPNYINNNSISEGFDTNSLIPNLTNNGTIKLTANFTNKVNDSNKNNFVFWDIVHPNGWVHKMAYQDILKLINN